MYGRSANLVPVYENKQYIKICKYKNIKKAKVELSTYVIKSIKISKYQNMKIKISKYQNIRFWNYPNIKISKYKNVKLSKRRYADIK